MKFMVALPSWLMSFRLSKLSNLNYSWNYLHFQIVLINNPTNFLLSLSLSTCWINIDSTIIPTTQIKIFSNFSNSIQSYIVRQQFSLRLRIIVPGDIFFSPKFRTFEQEKSWGKRRTGRKLSRFPGEEKESIEKREKLGPSNRPLLEPMNALAPRVSLRGN